MRLFALIILLLFAGLALYLSIYAERKMKDHAMYGGDALIKDIMIHNMTSNNKLGRARSDPPLPTHKQVIQYGGGVVIMPKEGSGNTYSHEVPLPVTNEGMPGQPLPLTGQPPMNPVYK